MSENVKQILIQITDTNINSLKEQFPEVENKNIYVITKDSEIKDRFQIDPYVEVIDENDKQIKKTLEDICAVFPKLKFCPEKQQGGVRSKKKKKNKSLKKKKKKRRTSQKGCGGTGSKPAVKPCDDENACTQEEQVRMFESDKRHSDFNKIINLGISISDEIPKAESLLKPNSKNVFSKGPITEIKNKFLGFGVQLTPTQHLIGDQTDNENAEKGLEKYGNNDDDEFMTLTGSPSGNEEEIKKIQARIEEENKKLAEYAIGLKQLDATTVILKQKGLKEILLDIFSKPNTLPLSEVNRIIDNYFISLKKELEDPLYNALRDLQLGVSNEEMLNRMRNLGMPIDNIQTFADIQKNHQTLILKYFKDNELYNALFNVEEKDNIPFFDGLIDEQDQRRKHRGGKKNRKKSTKKKRKKKKKKKRRRTMKKSRNKRGGAIPAMATLISFWELIDKGNFSSLQNSSEVTHYTDRYNKLKKEIENIPKEWHNQERHGLPTWEEAQERVKIPKIELDILTLTAKLKITLYEITKYKMERNGADAKLMELRETADGVYIDKKLAAQKILKPLQDYYRNKDTVQLLNTKIDDLNALNEAAKRTNVTPDITRFQKVISELFEKVDNEYIDQLGAQTKNLERLIDTQVAELEKRKVDNTNLKARKMRQKRAAIKIQNFIRKLGVRNFGEMKKEQDERSRMQSEDINIQNLPGVKTNYANLREYLKNKSENDTWKEELEKMNADMMEGLFAPAYKDESDSDDEEEKFGELG